jgi:hypothetical protein
MTSDRDIYAAALQLIRKHGAEGAGFHAAQRADEMLAQGAHEGMRVWQRNLGCYALSFTCCPQSKA